MDAIIANLLERITSFFANPLITFGLRAMAVYLVAVWIATAFWVWRDTRERTDSSLIAYLAAAFVLVSTPLLFLPVVLLYRLVRPSERVGERDERRLAEDVLLAELRAGHDCASCGAALDERWLACPSCRTPVGRRCQYCQEVMRAQWRLCAWCGRDRDDVPRDEQTRRPLPPRV